MLCVVELEEKALDFPISVIIDLSVFSYMIALVTVSFSSSKQILIRPPHGCVLGPTLFNIFINDGPSTISSRITLHAMN